MHARTKAGTAALVAAILMVVTGSQARAQPPRPGILGRDVAILQGPGSTIDATVIDPSSDVLSKARLSQPGGAVVQTVRERGPAARAGVKAGDLIVEFDGERVRSARHLTRLVSETVPNRATKMVVIRDGSRVTLDITPEQHDLQANGIGPNLDQLRRQLEWLPRDFEFDYDFDGPRKGIIMSPRVRLGINVTPLTDQLAAYFGTKGGALVTSVEADSPAAAAGLKAGDVVGSVNGRAVQNPDDVIEDVQRAQPGDTLALGIVRDKKPSTLKVTMPNQPARRNVVRERPI